MKVEQADIYKLAEMWVHNEITADEYFAAVEVRAQEAVRAELEWMRIRRRAKR